MTEQLQLLPLKQLKPAPDNPRRNVGDVAELAASIKAIGILEPIIATPNGKDGELTVVAGHRRLAAAKAAGLDEVPVITRSFTDAQRVEATLIENLQRVDLQPLEEAGAYRKLLDLGMTQHKLAERIGRSQSHISKRLALLDLPPVALKQLDSGGITLEDAVELTKLAKHPDRLTHALRERATNGYYRDMGQLVRLELEEQAAAEKRAASRAQLQSQGVKIFKESTDHYGNGLGGSNALALSGQGETWYSINQTIKQHADQPCHAALIQREGKVIYVCTKPSNHPKAKSDSYMGGRSVKANESERQPEAAKKKLQREQRAARADIARPLLKSVRKSSADFILQQLVVEASADHARIALELLDEKPTAKGGLGSYAPNVLATYAAKGESQLWKAAMALAFAAGENRLRSDYAYGTSRSSANRYLDLLKAAGYAPSSGERKLGK